MSNPYIGEIRMFGGNFAPLGWMFCQGQTLPIDQYSALFQLLGTTYGGDGINTFNLPDLQGRIPIHQGNYQGNPFILGQRAGTETVTLLTNQIPLHNHQLTASYKGSVSAAPNNNLLGGGERDAYASASTTLVTLAPNAINGGGSNLPHNNLQPVLAISFIISLFGIFPSQT
jgi:microcystin-dependent protein